MRRNLFNYLKFFSKALLVITILTTGCATFRSAHNAYSQTGLASWYGSQFVNQSTASGEKYLPHLLTAAHRSLPFNSRVRVTNLENGKSVIVRINDRGPFIKGRIIDLSYAAAKQINMIGKGIARVKVDLLPDN